MFGDNNLNTHICVEIWTLEFLLIRNEELTDYGCVPHCFSDICGTFGNETAENSCEDEKGKDFLEAHIDVWEFCDILKFDMVNIWPSCSLYRTSLTPYGNS